ncbi:hypothetical protein D3C75_692210 [compost metagenome]
MNMLKADSGQSGAHRQIACSMQRSVDNVELVAHGLNNFRTLAYCGNHLQESIIHVLADPLEQLPGFSRGAVQTFDLVEGKVADFADHQIRHMGNQLASIRSIDLIAVIFRRVMAGGDHDSGRCLEMADGKAQLRRGPQGFEYVGSNTVAG